MNDGVMQAMMELYGASKRRPDDPESSAYVDYCAGDSCNMIDEEADKTTVVPRGVAKRLDPRHFENMRRDGNEE